MLTMAGPTSTTLIIVKMRVWVSYRLRMKASVHREEVPCGDGML